MDDVFPAPKPVRESSGNGHPYGSHHKAEAHGKGESLPENGPGALEVVGAYAVGYLHGEAACNGHPKASEKPQASTHKAYGGSRRRPQMPHHGGVYILHEHRRQLRQYCRIAQEQRKLHLLEARKHPAAADLLKQYVFFTLHTEVLLCGL